MFSIKILMVKSVPELCRSSSVFHSDKPEAELGFRVWALRVQALLVYIDMLNYITCFKTSNAMRYSI